MWFAGFNGFGHFERTSNSHVEDTEVARSWQEFTATNPTLDPNLISSTWSYNAYGHRTQLRFQGAICGQLSTTETVDFEDPIKKLSATDKACLVLLANGDLFRVCPLSGTSTKLNFIAVEETAPSRGLRKAPIFPSDQTAVDEAIVGSKATQEVVTDIAQCETFSVALTSTNCLYTIPSKIYQFPRHERVAKMCGGAEHVLVLTTNGDVYAFGLSSRGQLGTGSTNSEELPVLVEALAGIKIVDIACGAWHSAAVSAFGDLYVWGWNVNGQLGRAVYTDSRVTFSSGRTDVVRHKMPSVFAEPQVVELTKGDKVNGAEQGAGDEGDLEKQYEVIRVHCGSRHTVVQTGCGQLLVCGWNKYGQLAVGGSGLDDVTSFTRVDTPAGWTGRVVCGRWCTILL